MRRHTGAALATLVLGLAAGSTAAQTSVHFGAGGVSGSFGFGGGFRFGGSFGGTQVFIGGFGTSLGMPAFGGSHGSFVTVPGYYPYGGWYGPWFDFPPGGFVEFDRPIPARPIPLRPPAGGATGLEPPAVEPDPAATPRPRTPPALTRPFGPIPNRPPPRLNP